MSGDRWERTACSRGRIGTQSRIDGEYPVVDRGTTVLPNSTTSAASPASESVERHAGRRMGSIGSVMSHGPERLQRDPGLLQSLRDAARGRDRMVGIAMDADRTDRCWKSCRRVITAPASTIGARARRLPRASLMAPTLAARNQLPGLV